MRRHAGASVLASDSISVNIRLDSIAAQEAGSRMTGIIGKRVSPHGIIIYDAVFIQIAQYIRYARLFERYTIKQHNFFMPAVAIYDIPSLMRYLFFLVTLKPRYLPVASRVCASMAGIEPNRIILTGNNTHCRSIIA